MAIQEKSCATVSACSTFTLLVAVFLLGSSSSLPAAWQWQLGVAANDVLGASTNHVEAPSAVLNIRVTTPKDDGYKEGFSWITLLATALLGSKPGYFWGTIPAKNMESACKIIEAGGRSVSVVVNAYHQTKRWNLKLVAIGGCDASSRSPEGVQAVFTDNTGRKSAIICEDKIALKHGCAVYNTGSDVDNLYNKHKLLLANPVNHTSISNRRELLDGNIIGDCAGSGASSGAVTGAVTALNCLETGVLFPFCAAGVIGIQAAIGAAASCAAAACFPGDATAMIEGGYHKRVSDLAIGEKVAVLKPNGEVGYDAIYAFGHSDAYVKYHFVKLKMKPFSGSVGLPDTTTKSLVLSSGHFVPTSPTDSDKKVYKRAGNIWPGDIMWAISDDSLRTVHTKPYVVTGVSTTVNQGLFNPFTMSGTIVVDGVVASVHSDWFLDNLFDSLGMPQLLPVAYQIVLAPARVLYHILGKEVYTRIYAYLDTHLNLARFGMDYGSAIATAMATFSVILAYILSISCLYQNKRKHKQG